ncbi:MAG: hypothetical protein MGU50_11360 [Trichodesmium sp. MAG_R02]|nr:hypothetical protein [Trichodesmium sp. MAG_R02]
MHATSLLWSTNMKTAVKYLRKADHLFGVGLLILQDLGIQIKIYTICRG